MKILMAVFIIAFNYQCLLAQNNNATYIENSKGLCNGIYLDVENLISNRTPTLDKLKFGSNVNLPSTCLSNLNEKLLEDINSYRSQDRSNAQSIVNNYCSHMKGWVEYNPGTCQAGGPPPICPAHHWYQNPSQSTDDFYKERNKVYNEKLNNLEQKKTSLMNEACSCWLNDLKENGISTTYKNATPYQSDGSQLYQTTGILIPCLNGDCPIGFKCVNGYCIESSVQSNVRNNTTLSYEKQDKVKDKLRDVAIDKVLDYAEKKFKDLALLRGFYKAAMSNPYSTVVAGVLETPTLGTYSSIYQKELLNAHSNANQLEKLYDEQRRFKHNLNMTTANIQQRKNDIAKYRSELGKNLFNIENATSGIETEKELGSCSCYNVLNYQRSLVTTALTDLMNKEIDW